MICDRASNSCALKGSTSTASTYKSVLLTLGHSHATIDDGIVCGDVEPSTNTLCMLASGSMVHADRQILNLMLSKIRAESRTK